MKLRHKNTHREGRQSTKRVGVKVLFILIMSLFVVNFTSAFAWTGDLNTGIISYYACEEGTGTVVGDYINGNNYTLVNSSGTTWAGGIIGDGLGFIRANEEYLNSHCEKCKDGTTNRDCTYLSHKITIGMVEYSKWDILKGEEE